ncbi:MAG TPA: TolC family protein [Steroidobacteraceae bacterium]|nr:TolC family protein [Steroidobacteraceae bacterium]
MRRAPLLVAALMLWVTSGSAGAAAPLPGQDAALAAIDERPAVREALALQDAAAERARALRVGPHEFALSGVWQERDVEGEGTYNEWEASLTRGVRWPGKVRVDRSLAEIELERAENSLADARHTEARVLLSHWFGWLRAETEARHDRELADSLARVAGAVREQSERGDASAMQLELANAEAERSAAAASRSVIAARQARRSLAIAYPALDLPGQPPDVPAPEAPARPWQDWVSLIIERSHELRLAELAEQGAQLRAERLSSDRWPDPTVGVRVLDERGGAEEVVGVVLHLPLPGRYRTAVAAEGRREAEAAIARSELARREIETIAEMDVEDARAALASWTPLEKAARYASRHLQRAERAHQLGETGLTELLLSVISSLETVHEERMARLDAHESIAKLRIDAHELWARPDAEHDEH